MEHLNRAWFAKLNASGYLQGYQLGLAIFLAKYLIIFIFLALVALWLGGNSQHRNTLISALCAVTIALGLNWIIGQVWYHPRPFVLGLGHTYLNHAPDSSFPSDHTTILCTISFVFLWRGAIKNLIGATLLLATACVAWARIYVGVHFPFDIIGAILVSLVASACVIYFSSLIECYLFPVSEFIHSQIFKYRVGRQKNG